jgi:hypothetical protein
VLSSHLWFTFSFTAFGFYVWLGFDVSEGIITLMTEVVSPSDTSMESTSLHGATFYKTRTFILVSVRT